MVTPNRLGQNMLILQMKSPRNDIRSVYKIK